MKTAFVQMFETESEAAEACRIRNRAYRRVGNRSDLVVVVDGPSDDYAVVDSVSAIGMEIPYSWYL